MDFSGMCNSIFYLGKGATMSNVGDAKIRLVQEVIQQIKNDFERVNEHGDSYEVFVRNMLMRVDDDILNEYLNY